VVKLVGMFLSHKDPDAVAAGIEALAEIGDPSAIKLIEPLVDDPRTVELADDGGDETSEASIGELAVEAIELLKDYEGEGEA
jgi:HEAT repeat protein